MSSRSFSARFALFASLAFAGSARADAEGCKEHPLLPTRIPGYVLTSCEAAEFSSFEFATEDLGAQVVEGKKTVLRYDLPEGGKPQSSVFIVKNYQEALKKIGARVRNRQEFGYAVSAQLKRADQEIWVAINGYVGEATVEQTGAYSIVIVEKGVMQQVVAAADILDELARTGRATIYVQFDSGKATIKAESEPLLAEMAKVLKQRAQQGFYVVGHTDMQGPLADNLKLSEARAAAVVVGLTGKHGVAAKQLVAKGVGPLSPLAFNGNEDGRKVNRRVELVAIEAGK
jgi:outer membrane protein OmpA-like peptidoglycan-associated protein